MREIQLTAADVVGNVLRGRSLTDELTAAWRRQPDLSPQQRGAIQDICYGVLRQLGLIDALLQALLKQPLAQERLRQLLRIALYQLQFTRAASHAIVDHAVSCCAAVGAPAAKGLTNAVLRNFLRRREPLLEQAARTETGRYSHPQWWIDKLKQDYPSRYAQILDADNRRAALVLRVNVRRTSLADYLQRLQQENIAARAIGAVGVKLDEALPVEKIPGFAQGLVSVQDAAAQRAAGLLDLQPGQRVLDACAAPGGKAAHILESADVTLQTVDVDADRLARVSQNFARLGLHADCKRGDAGAPVSWWDGRPYDRILLDAPCTGSGVVRRHPDIKWLRRPTDIKGAAAQQARLLEALWQLLGTGGKLLYATCSVFPEENHLQVAGFLQRHADAVRLALPQADNQNQEPAGQILPDDEHDGFFYALLQKN